MKKIFLILGALIIALAMVACKDDKNSSGAGKESSIAIVNLGDIVQKAESAKTAKVYLEKLSGEMEADIRGIQESIEKAPDSKKDELKEKLQTTLTNYQQKFRAEEQQVRLNFTEEYQKALDDYRKEHDITVILHSDAVVSADEKVDVTKEILAAMDSSFKSKSNSTIKESAPASEGNATSKDSASEGNSTSKESPASGNSTK